MFDKAIHYFNRLPLGAGHFDADLDGFQNFLTSSGIRYFSAREMTTPNHQAKARAAGYDVFLPEQDWWERGAALAAVADALREMVGEPVRMRNWWRPEPYNSAVGGAKGGDHPTAHGVDLDYQSVASRKQAEARLREYAKDAPWLALSLGLGPRTTHVGLLSPKGAREWYYRGHEKYRG